jgi:choline dehydrogenase
VHLGHYTHPDDVQRGVALVGLAREVIDRVAANGLIKAPVDAWWRSADVAPLLRSRAASYHHPVGTCRMGSGADCVVGTDLQVHGVAGLYVADASVMPALPTGTTNLATMMIGWRAAELSALP